MANLDKTYVVCFLFLVGVSTTLSQLAGGISDADINDAGIQEVHNWLQSSDGLGLNENSLQLISARTQIVAGINYFLTYKAEGSQETCETTIWMHPGGEKEVTDDTCAELQKSALEIEVGDEDVLNAVNAAMRWINKASNNLYLTVPTHMLDVKKQAQDDSNVKYDMKLRLGFSKSCRNKDEEKLPTVQECPVSYESPETFQTCLVSIVYQPSSNEKYSRPDVRCLRNGAGKTSEDFGVKMAKNPKFNLGGGDHDFAHYGVFSNFKEKYNKKYASHSEDMYRFNIFRENMRKIQEIQDNEMGSATYGQTEFADLTAEEFRRGHLTPTWDISTDRFLTEAEIPEGDPPASFDWRDHNAVTEVKNQGSCGSCWAFSVTGNVEGQWAIAKKNLISLSEQELVDCDKLDDGCMGGLPTNAYKEIIRLGGLEKETNYPYDGEDEKCSFNKSEVSVKINGAVNISSDEAQMASWLAKNGPISIGINAMAMQFYFGGVSHPWKIFCSPESLDHGVLIVGYGTEKGWFGDNPYWIVKNSWGTFWGEKGYYRVYRGDGTCGVNQMPTSATVQHGED